MKVLLRVPLSPYSGYGNDGIGIARAMLRWGIDVYLEPTSVQAPLPEDVAQLLTKPLQAPFDLILHHVDPAALEMTETVASAGELNVAWTMWEYSNFHNLPGRSKLKKKLKLYDAVVAYDPVSQACITEYYRGFVPIVQGGFWPEDWPEVKRDWHSERFGFCMVGQLHERKNPFVAIQAFNELKHEYPEEFAPAELHLKTNLPGLHSGLEQVIPKLKVHFATWSDDVLRQFYAAQHVLISTSRGEGKNMPALEFQSTGGTVIATNWGGHQQWLNSEYNYPLDYSLTPVPGSPNTEWAAASVEHLKEQMLHTFRNRAEARRKGELAAQIIPKMSSWDSVLERLFHQLDTTEKGRGIWAKAAAAAPKRD